jgi:hypothetical protein
LTTVGEELPKYEVPNSTSLSSGLHLVQFLKEIRHFVINSLTIRLASKKTPTYGILKAQTHKEGYKSIRGGQRDIHQT